MDEGSSPAAQLVGVALVVAIVATGMLVAAGCVRKAGAEPAAKPPLPMIRVEDVEVKDVGKLLKTYSTDYFTIYEYTPTSRTTPCVIVNGVHGTAVSC